MTPLPPQGRVLSPVVQGALWMVLAACLLGTLSLMVRHIAGALHPFEVAFFRNLGQLVFMLPWLAVAGIQAVRTRRVWAHVRRSVFGMGAMLSWFTVLTLMPLAEATAISFSSPLFTTAGAALFLGEKVGVRRWSATALGFIGVLMIIRPGFEEVTWAQGLALAAAAMMAGSMLSNKSLARTESPNAMVLWMGLFMSVFSLPPALAVWQWPEAPVWGWLVALGLVATLGHLAITRAYAIADVSFVAPFGFTQIPFVALAGYILYAETPGPWTWAGAFVIVASGIYTAQREARVHRRTHAAPLAPEIAAVGSADLDDAENGVKDEAGNGTRAR